MVESQPSKLLVAGPIPVSRSNRRRHSSVGGASDLQSYSHAANVLKIKVLQYRKSHCDNV